ncbi:MAG: 6-phosphofructokinase, partial [Oscillospiraceae bacterium]|nr:6-phosphofructokinase [Oscillospiraceae bacterium]
YDMFSVIVVEIMGRNAGWLTAAAALARDSFATADSEQAMSRTDAAASVRTSPEAPQLIYLPESPFDPEDFIRRVASYSDKNQLLIVAVSEGIKDKDGGYISAAGASRDKFGHVALAGTGRYLEQLIKDRLGCKVRSIEFSVLQRAAGHYASATDIAEALAIGEAAVRAALRGETGVMMAFERISNEPYLVRCGTVPIEAAANLEKTVPADWIVDGCDVSAEMLAYLRPLVAGRAPCYEQNGVPSYLFLDKKVVEKP